MRKTMTKALAVLATSAALTVTGAGIASADSGFGDETSNDTRSSQTDVRDSGNINLKDLADLGVDVGGLDLGGLLNGNDTDVSDNGNGNASGNEDNSSNDDNSSSEDNSSTDGGEDNNSGLLGGLL